MRARYLSCELGGRGVSGFPWGRPGGAWEAGLLSVGDEGSTLVPEETRAGTQSDLVRNLARKSREVHWGGRPRKGSLSAEGSPGKGGDLLEGSFGRRQRSEGIQRRVLRGNLRKFCAWRLINSCFREQENPCFSLII